EIVEREYVRGRGGGAHLDAIEELRIEQRGAQEELDRGVKVVLDFRHVFGRELLEREVAVDLVARERAAEQALSERLDRAPKAGRVVRTRGGARDERGTARGIRDRPARHVLGERGEPVHVGLRGRLQGRV